MTQESLTLLAILFFPIGIVALVVAIIHSHKHYPSEQRKY